MAFGDYFELKIDCTILLGFHLFINARRSYGALLTGYPADALNDYLRMSESTAVEATYRFCKAVV